MKHMIMDGKLYTSRVEGNAMPTRMIRPLMGILFVVIVFVAFVVGGETPQVDDSGRDIVSFYRDNETQQQISAALLALACVAFLFFLSSVRQTLRGAMADRGGFSAVVFAGGIMITVGISIFAGIGFTLGDAADDLPGAAILALNALNSNLFFPVAVGTAVFNLGLGFAIVRNGGLPRSLGWAAIVVGIAGITPLGFFAFLATGVVIIWASIAITRLVKAPQSPSDVAP
ncbi:MAG: hypothetical protein HOQ05_03130 [Corynebacteriales bacterium]|nr:hypothetical protein [Mycobacteriales bacterium]